MTSPKPYLIRSFYEWILSNNRCPFIAVDATFDGVVVPQDYVRNGRIAFDISPSCTNDLVIGDEAVEFKARFSGVSRKIYIPIDAIVALYEPEDNQGIVLKNEDEISESSSTANQSQPATVRAKKPSLHVISGNKKPPTNH